MRILPGNKVTTIKPEEVKPVTDYGDETFDHVLWLAKLNSKQLKIVDELLKDLWDDKYWEGVNKHEVRGMLEAWARRINDGR